MKNLELTLKKLKRKHNKKYQIRVWKEFRKDLAVMVKRKKSLSNLNKLVTRLADGENVPGDKVLHDE